MIRCTVHDGILSKGDGVGEGIQNAAAGAENGKVSAGRGINPVHFLPVNETHAGNAVDFAPLDKGKEPRSVLLGKADDELSCAFKRNIQLFGHGIEFGIAFNGTGSLERAWLVEKSGVQHAGVPATGLGADVAFLLKYADRKCVPCQFSCNGTSDNTSADDDDIIALHFVAPF